MPENQLKMPRSASPVARAGAGDISERELSRERHKLQASTPPARLHPANPKKQLFLTPVSKFTASQRAPGSYAGRLHRCLGQYTAPVKHARITAKAASMEDLTPTKKQKKIAIKSVKSECRVRPVRLHGANAETAGARVAVFMLVAAWRRRRDELRCLRRTLEFQVSSSERLRLQVCALKSLLDSDNQKALFAVREMERLRQLLQQTDKEKDLLQREKVALEKDVSTAEDRASEMSIGWRNCRNELECLRATFAAAERALALERAAAASARHQRDHAHDRLSLIEEDMAQQDELLAGADAAAAALQRELEAMRLALAHATDQLQAEQEAHEDCARSYAELVCSVSRGEAERRELREHTDRLSSQLDDTRAELAEARRRLNWWPNSITRVWSWGRGWLRPVSPPALLWAAHTHGCARFTQHML